MPNFSRCGSTKTATFGPQPPLVSGPFSRLSTVGVARFLGVYNFVRRHTRLGTTPAVAAGVELEAWGLEDVVEMTVAYQRRKADAEFEKAFAAAGL